MSANSGGKTPASLPQSPQPVAAWVPLAPQQRQSDDTQRVVVAVVIAVVLIIASSIAGAWILYRMISLPTDYGDQIFYVGIAVSNTSSNWTLTVASISAPSDLSPSGVFLTIYDNNGVDRLHAVALSDLNQSSWIVNGALYRQLVARSFIGVGDSILVDKTTYPSGDNFELTSSTSILFHGTLR